ncbi:hypothetical protein F4561_005207 [Lipingzhangella halophila]|uniref:Uncharacterized protein n=1 Tax=Lipingzhangella halophila TaxID=1783352 RepID=A0A7W7RMA8_9ACTN|nr:hypothetical protein [Lipingzhangella halophila]
MGEVTAGERMCARVTAAFVEDEASVGLERRVAMWPRVVAETPNISDGAALAGWDAEAFSS